MDFDLAAKIAAFVVWLILVIVLIALILVRRKHPKD